ncbi:MAG TPA: protein kinase [Polyangiaceae bacterium]|jgi:serine/threonine-protein kinase|nr:protein kinase [Polyangiaceae bacterium]
MITGPPPAASELSSRGHRLLGRYELIGELARGGMGTVYLARNAGEGRFQRLFAIKVLHPHLAAETAFIDMMRDEAHIAARLHHPNVVPILDLGTEGDLHYVVMEYIEGPALSTLLKRSPENRPAELVVAIVIDALDGLHAAHSLQDDDGKEIRLVHRDVSPPNILVGSDGIGRITDFGIAKAEARISSTRPGMRKGKLQYMSPEQIRDSDIVDYRTDVWAAGAVLWNALTAKNLFKGEGDGATIHNIIEKPIPAPSTEGLKPPSCFDAIVLRALSRSPADRYATALEMADALRVTAAGNGLAGSKHQVARWVAELFGDELDQRRKAIREASQRRGELHDHADASQVNVLAPAASIIRPLPSGAVTLTHLSHIPSFSIEPSSTGTLSAPALPGGRPGSEPPNFRLRKNRMWLALALAGVALIAILALVTRSPDDEASSRNREGENRPATPSSDLPVPANEQVHGVEPHPAPPAPTLDTDQTAPARVGEDDKRFGRSVPRKAPLHSAPVKEPTREPKTEPRENAAPAPRPAPQPAPTDDFEKNPYLRR